MIFRIILKQIYIHSRSYNNVLNARFNRQLFNKVVDVLIACIDLLLVKEQREGRRFIILIR